MNGFEVLRRALDADNAIAGDVAALRASVCVHSLTVLGPVEGATTRISAVLATRAIGAKSLMVS